jgi:Transmembrane protein 43
MSIGGDWSGGGGFGSDSYTEVSSQGWFSRIGGALVGIPIGLLLFLASFVVLFWNEGRSVRTARSLAEGQEAVVTVSADRVDPAHESALVHVSGTAATDETLKDPQFPVSAKALRLVRDVKMYQWLEKQETHSRRKVGGGEEKTTEYTYTKNWADRPIDSSRFKVPAGHENPRDWRFEGRSMDAGAVTLGAFQLSPDLVRLINKFEPLRIDEAARDALPEDLHDRLRVENGRFYQGANPAAPQVGDVSVEFRQVQPTEVSVLAEQVGGSFRPYQTKSGDAINRLQLGLVSAADMFHAAEAENNLWTWALRLLGFVLMSSGIGMVLRPLAVVGDVIPFIGDVIRFGTGFVAAGIGLVLSLVTIALGWITFRPLVGLAVLAVAGLALYCFFRLARDRRRAVPGKRQPSLGTA